MAFNRTNLRKISIFFFFLIISILQSYSQSVGDYRSAAVNLNWNSTASWERYDGALWILNPVEGYPGENVGTGNVLIRDGHSVTLNVAPANAIGSLTVGEGLTGLLTTDGNIQTLIVTGNLNVLSGAVYDIFHTELTILGNTTIDGSLNDSNDDGFEIFSGSFTISATGSVNISANSDITFNALFTNNGIFIVSSSSSVYFENGIVNNNQFDISGIGSHCIFRINNQTITGSEGLTIINLDVNGPIQISNQNTDTIKISTSFDGTDVASEWINDNGTVLEYSGANAIMNTGILNASTSTNTINYNGIIGQSIKDATYSKLIISGNSAKTLSSNVSVNDSLILLSGIINTGVNKLILGVDALNTGGLSYTNGSIIGNFERWINTTGISYLFPVGTALNNNNISFVFNSGLTNGSILLSFVPGDPGNAGLPLIDNYQNVDGNFTEAYWNAIAQNSFDCSDYNVILAANGFSSFTINGQTRLLKRTNGGNWILDGTHDNASSPYCYRNGLNGISTLGTQFALGDVSCISPVITTNSINDTLCTGQNTTFFVVATGATNYQWQLSIDNGSTWNDITVAGTDPVHSDWTTNTLQLNSVIAVDSGYQYRCVITNACPTSTIGNESILSVFEAPVISTQPINSSVCESGNTTFSLLATGDGLTYQWQLSTDLGSTWNDQADGGVYSGMTTNTMNITTATSAMDTYQYRCIVTGDCNPTVTSNAAILTVNTSPAITVNPVNSTICENANTTFSVTATGSGLTYQWQLSIDGGSTWNDQADGGVYSDMTTNTMTITAATFSMSTYQYRCVVTGACAPSVTSSGGELTVNELPTITVQPVNAGVCENDNASFTLTASGTGITYQWQLSTDGGSTWNDEADGGVYSGMTTNSMTITTVPVSMDTYQYRCVVSGSCLPNAVSNAVELTLNTPPAVTVQPIPSTICENSNTSFSVTATGNGLTYQWQLSTDGGVFWNDQADGGVYSDMTTNTMSITNASSSMDAYHYRCVVSGTCAPVAISNDVHFTVNAAPLVTVQPVNRTICEGANTTISVTATGIGLTYQWQLSIDGGATWNDQGNGGVYSTMTTSTMRITGALAGMDSYQYRCVVTGTCAPSAISNAGVLTVNTAPIILTNPRDTAVCVGNGFLMNVTATGAGLTYQWEASINGGVSYINVTDWAGNDGVTTPSLIYYSSAIGYNGYLWRCKVSGTCAPIVYSTSAILTIYSKPAITVQPLNSTICSGGNAIFNITATGAGLTYQWQENQGSGWNNLADAGVYSGVTTNSLLLTAVPSTMTAYQYRCVVSGTCTPSVTSSARTLTVNSVPNISVQPIDRTICAGANTTFAITASGTSITYQWQLSTDAGFSWNNLANGGVYSNVTTATMSITGAIAGMDSYQYRCVVSGTCAPTATSNVSLLTVNTAPSITAQPVDASACPTANTSFSVTATGTALTYQWQLSINGGGIWNNQANGGVYSGMTTSSMTITGAIAGMNNYRYRCVVSGTCTPAATSNGAILTMLTAPAISAQPANRTICAGTNTTYSVTASGSGLTYQWQLSTDGGTNWNNQADGGVYSGMTTATMTITGATTAMTTYRYRCVITGTCGTLNSNNGLLTVNALPAITVQPPTRNLCSGNNTTFGVTATGAGLTYQWQLSLDGGATWNNITVAGASPTYANWTTATLTVNGIIIGNDGYNYRCIVSGTCTPSVTSNAGVLYVGTPPSITGQPASNIICAGNNATFSLTATGSGLTYQWQENVGMGWNNLANGGVYSGVTTASMLITAAPVSMNSYQYRCVVTGSCTPVANSNVATLTVNTAPAITSQPSNRTICEGINTSFSVTATGTALSYQWQLSTDGGGSWNNITIAGTNPVYSGWTSSTLSLTGVGIVNNNNQYRCVLSGTCPPNLNTNAVSLTVNASPVITVQPSNLTVCEGDNNSIPLTATGSGLTYQWQVSSNAGVTWGNINEGGVYTNTTSTSLSINGATANMNGNLFRCIVGNCSPQVVSNTSTITVNTLPEIYSSGNVKWERFAGYTYLGAQNFSNLSADITTVPTETRILTSLDAPLNTADNYMARIKGYLYITEPGNYTFYFASDDNGAFYLSSDSTKANLSRRCYVTGWTGYQEWNKYAQQQSAVIPLAVGFYYFEMFMQEGGGLDNMSLAWTTPSNATIRVIGSSNISQSTSVLYGQPVNSNVCVNDSTYFTVIATGTAITYQWQVSTNGGGTWNNITVAGTNPTYANWTTASLKLTGVAASNDGYRYRCVISGACTPSVTSVSANLSINQSPPTNNIKWERFNGYTGNLTALSADNVTAPSVTQVLTSLDAPFNIADNYKARIKGFLNISEAGKYIFYIASDDQSEFWLSTNSNPANKILRCNVVNAKTHNNFTATLGTPGGVGYQNSDSITLSVGYYYFEMLMQEGGGQDNLSLAWKTPSNGTITVIPSTNISQTAPIFFIAQPVYDTICQGGSTSFTISAYGSGLAYQWQVSTNGGGTWNNITAAGTNPTYSNWTTTTLGLSGIALANDDYLYRCQVSSNCAPTANSDPAKIEVNAPPVITSEPSNTSTCEGSTASFSITATGTFLTYQWQESTNGGVSWTNLMNSTYYSNVYTSTLNLTGVRYWMNNYQYRCLVNQCVPSIASIGAVLSVNIPAVIQTPGVVKWEFFDDYAGTFTALATDFTTVPNATQFLTSISAPSGYADTYSSRTKGYIYIPETGSYTFYIASDDNSEFWLSSDTSAKNLARKCYVTGYTGVNEWTKYPSQASTAMVLDSGFYYFEAYQQDGTGGDNMSVGWITPTNGTTTVIPAANISLTPSLVNGQPQDINVCSGDNATFTISAVGSASLTYQWQLSSDGGTVWNNITAAGANPTYSNWTTATLTITGVVAGVNNYKYRCIVTSPCGSNTSNAATLRLTTPPTNNVKWERFAGYAGSLAVLSADVVTVPTETRIITSLDAPFNTANNYKSRIKGYLYLTEAGNYRFWIASDDQGEFWLSSNVDPANKVRQCYEDGWAAHNVWNNGIERSAILNLNPGYYYFELLHQEGTGGDNLSLGWTTPSNAVTSVVPSANITQYAPTVVGSHPSNSSLCPGGNTNFNVTVSGGNLTYQWQVSTDGGSTWNNITAAGSNPTYANWTTSSLTVNGVVIGNNGNQYRCYVTGSCATNATSNVATLTVTTTPAITVQPLSTTICSGQNTSYFITATGTALTYQWQVSIDGGSTWNNQANGGVYSGMTTNTMTITAATAVMNNYQYRCVVSGCPPSATSDPAILTVNSSPTISTQPSNSTACATTNTTFTVAATGTALTYQWQESTDGGTNWNNISNGGIYSGATNATITLTGLTTGMNNYRYRCIISGTCAPSTTSNSATLTVNTLPTVTANPVDRTICQGTNTTFVITATGTGITYQWQLSIDGGSTWNNQANGGVYSGMTTATMTITGAASGMSNYRYRCVVSGTCSPAATSAAGILTVNTPPAITAQPSNTTVCVSSNTTISITATGGSLTYQWQENQGSGWNNLSNGGVYGGVSTNTLSLMNVLSVMNNYQYRCVVTGVCAPITATSNAVVLTVNSLPTVTVQPTNSTICDGDNTTFAVTATGTGITYQWQLSTDGGGSWNNQADGGVYSGMTSNTMTITAAIATMNTYRYRCVVTGSCAPVANSNAAVLTVNSLPSISAQPVNAIVCETANTSFSITASGTGITYQWQLTTDGGGTWNNLSNGGVYSGVTLNTLTITGALAAMDNYEYRCIVSGTCSPSETSSSAQLIVNSLPAITVQPVNSAICENSNGTFSVTASGTGLTYQWQLSIDGGSTWNNQADGGVYSDMTTDNMTITAAPLSMNNYQYRCIVSGTCAPSKTSNPAILTINTAPSITTQPTNASVCATSNITFSVTASGSGLSYQWQLSTNNGVTWNNQANIGVYTGMTTATMTITGATTGMNNYQYRCVVSGSCAPSAISNAAILTVNSLPAITSHPINRTICEGANTTFAVTATGTGISYQWQLSTDGGSTWNDQANGGVYSGMTTATMSITAAIVSMNSYYYRCVVNGTCAPSAISNAGVLTINTSPVILTNPRDTAVCVGNGFLMNVSAIGAGLTYQWEASINGGFSYVNVTDWAGNDGVTTSSLIYYTSSIGYNGYLWRCKVSGTCSPIAYSSSAILTINSLPSISSQPVNRVICEGQNTTFAVTGTGTGLMYQWQENQGSGWNNISNGGVYGGVSTNTLSLTNVSSTMNGYTYQCVVSGTCTPSVTSIARTLTVNTLPSITSQPSNNTVCSGASTSFVVSATGTALTYQWQFSIDGGGTWANRANGGGYSGATTNTLTINPTTVGMNNYQFRCIVSGICAPSVTSNAVTLTVNTLPSISTQPTNKTICEGLNTTFAVVANGTALTYQWQVSTDLGVSWNNQADGGVYSGMTTATMTITGATAVMTTYRYRCIVSGTCNPSVTSAGGILTVNTSPVINTQPSNTTVCVGASTSYTVAATGSGLTYQWQFSINGGSTWNNRANGGGYSGATTATLSINPTIIGMNSYQFRCIVSGTCTPSVTSNAAILTLNTLPAVSTHPINHQICAGTNTSFSVVATGTSLTYQWQLSTNGGSTWANQVDGGVYSDMTTATMSITGALTTMNSYQYRCVVSGTCNPAANSNAGILTVYTLPVASASNNGAVCVGSSLSLGSLPNAMSNYSWTGPSSYSSNQQNPTVNSSATLAMAGTYTVTVTDGNNCTNTANTVVVVNSNPTMSITPNPASICAGGSLSMDGNPAGGSIPYSHSWTGTGASELSNISIQSPTFSTSSAGAYILTYTVTDNNGCTATGNRNVTVNVGVTASVSPDPALYCTGVGLNMNGNPSGGTMPYTHLWTGNGSDSLTNKTIQSPVFNSQNAGVFKLIYRVTDDNGCIGIDSVDVNTNVTPVATLIALSTADTICNGSNTTLRVDFTAGTAPYSFTWSNGTSTGTLNNINSDPYDFSPATAPVWTAGKFTAYTYTITSLTDVNGCVNSTGLGNAVVRVAKKPDTGDGYKIQNTYNP